MFKGNGDGTFTAKGTFNVGTTSQQIALADTDKDGTLDIVISNQNGALGITALANNGGFTFSLPAFTAAANNGKIFGFALADVNRDSKLDLVGADQKNKEAQVFLGH